MEEDRAWWSQMVVTTPADAIKRQIGWLNDRLREIDGEIRKLENLRANRQHIVDELAEFEIALEKLS
jgi:hypothetical protein